LIVGDSGSSSNSNVALPSNQKCNMSVTDLAVNDIPDISNGSGALTEVRW
jgi:hypothetical protein